MGRGSVLSNSDGVEKSQMIAGSTRLAPALRKLLSMHSQRRAPRRRSRLRVAALALALSGLGAATARAEPSAMKEQSQHPRLEVVSQDGRYAVAVGGFLQARYAAGFSHDGVESSSFGIPRTRLYVFGRIFSREIRYRLMIGTAPNQLQVRLYDAYMEWTGHTALRLRGGFFKVPVTREWMESARMLHSIDRSFGARTLSPGRSAGVMVSGAAAGERFEYWLGLFSGVDDGRGEAGAGGQFGGLIPTLAGRALWNTTGRTIEGEIDLGRSPLALSLGGSGYGSFDPKAAAGPTRTWMASGELALRARGFDAASELSYRDHAEGPRRSRILGAYARANYFIAPARLAVGPRISHTRSWEDPLLTRTELDLDLSALLDGHDLKLQLSGGPAYSPALGAWHGVTQIQIQGAF